MKPNRTLLAVLTLAFCGSMYGPGNGESTTTWAIKTGLGSAITNNYSLEVERRFGKRISLTSQAAIVNPQIGRGNDPRIDGYFFKAGPKFYLSADRAEDLSGLAVQAKATYGRWHDWDFYPRDCSRGGRWEHSVGLLISGSYAIRIFQRVRLEPSPLSASYLHLKRGIAHIEILPNPAHPMSRRKGNGVI